MNRQQRRAHNRQLPPRPQLIPEQLRDQIGPNIPRVLNRQECIEFAVMLAANLERLLNNRTQLPWITCSIDKRNDGFSLHVDAIQPSTDTDAEVIQ